MSVAISIPPPVEGDKPPLVVIAGATATGKSALALDLAARTGGVIINADASQLYADLRILSARPSAADEARAPHRLYGALDAADPASAARWAAMARGEIAAAHGAGQLPILVGGSGLYLRTLLDGIAPVPPVDPAVRAAVLALPLADAHAALVGEDPAAAARLAPADRTRVTRALEVVRATGRPLADWHREPGGGIGGAVTLSASVVEVPREALARRIDTRVAAMIDADALAEVEALAARRLSPMLPAMKAIGVPELLAVIAGLTTLAGAQTAMALATRRYAKRQRTWFANQCGGWTRVTLPEDAATLR